MCDDGFTYAFYFRNEPPPEKYPHLGGLHARCMALFDLLDDECHEVGVGNLYTAAKFLREAWNHPKKVKVHGVR